MSDMRFVIVGMGLVFAGFIILGVFGHNYAAATFEQSEFGTCYEYADDTAPVKINCSFKVFDQSVFFGAVIGLIGAGVLSLIKGARGDWDNKLKPEDAVGPGRTNSDDIE